MAHNAITPDLSTYLEFDHVSLSMPRSRRRKGTGRRARVRRMAGEVRREEVPVLTDVSLRIDPGEAVAVVGLKTSGRQEMLRLAAGTLIPDSGTVRRRDAVLPMIEIGRAFNRVYTIRQNIYVAAGLFGMKPDAVTEAIPAIAERAGVTGTLDRYLGKTKYVVRQKLAWSIAMAVDAPAYAIDQIVVVGEPRFREECWTHLEELRGKGRTFLVVADDQTMLRRLCDRAVFLDDGAIAAETSVEDALAMLREARRRAGGDAAEQADVDDHDPEWRDE